MVEILSDMTMVWVTVIMTVLVVAAFTKANVLMIEWELRASWKRQHIRIDDHAEWNSSLIQPSSKQYRPKIPSLIDHKKNDDEDPILVVF
ncbi:hypothetical protein [Halalkalibacter okhensis]|uniref:Uncharacterized protein n=1 Tax=Halalkalibacter okhensis TaxID=333138 RepID=A0A0B0IPR2_9BACI|nr:hypothetical protein [Halalkalibacter okhensis]KHF42059.1 hypothetical protein LQ50_01880 [Halalkalibacter okhensis]